MKALLLALACLAPDAHARPLAVEVRYWEGDAAFSKTLKVEPAESLSTTGVVRGAGGAKRLFIINLLPVFSREGVMDLQYQVEFSPLGGRDGTILMPQGSVFLAEGRPLRAVDCGTWRLELGLAPLGATVSGSDFGADLGNQRVTASVAAGVEKWLCSLVVQGSVTSNLTLAHKQGDSYPGLSLRLKTMPSPGAGAEVRYRVEITTPGAGVPYASTGAAIVPLGRRSDVAGGRLGLTFEGEETGWKVTESFRRGVPRAPESLGLRPRWATPRFKRYADDFIAFDVAEGWTVKGAGDGERGYAFHLHPPEGTPLGEAYRAFGFTWPYSRRKEIPDGDHEAFVDGRVRQQQHTEWTDDGSGPSRRVTSAVKVRVKGGACFSVLNEHVVHPCEDLDDAARLKRGGCYSSGHFAECLSDKGVRLAIPSSLGVDHDAPGELKDDERDALALAERRLRSLEFRGAVPKAAFLKD